ncbi:MAG: methylenetetrahydrofolate reductase [NAD(P)H] [Bacteroidales bacterium]|nr:methylenetetrahydrofolate reductase [NAD(P)H] [Bacteroidales bacterium]HPD94881.1 methylenetetrahydrofolate reductase [NAD(P)H] [Tenuifilaceae bacterium]
MKVIDIINNSKTTQFSFELLPPLKGNNIQTIFDTIDKLAEFSPAYINITYHREEIVSRPGVSGGVEFVKVRRRPGTVSVAAAIQQRYKIDVVPHLICGGFDMQETEDALIDLDFLNIQNVLVLRGDADKITGKFEPKVGGHRHAADLVRQISNLNKGIYFESLMEKPEPTDFCIGVGGYPEKHPEAPNFESDIQHLKEKVDAGASYVVTQMFFDNKKYFDFVNECRAIGITVPIIPGLKPITVKDHTNILPRVFNTQIPQELVREIEKCKSNKDVYQLGIEWTTMQAKELKAANVPAIHFYTMGRPNNIAQIAKIIF